MFLNFTGKHLCWSLSLINFVKTRLQHRCFLWKLRNFKEHLFWKTSAKCCFCVLENFSLEVKHWVFWIDFTIRNMKLKLRTPIVRSFPRNISSKKLPHINKFLKVFLKLFSVLIGQKKKDRWSRSSLL